MFVKFSIMEYVCVHDNIFLSMACNALTLIKWNRHIGCADTLDLVFTQSYSVVFKNHTKMRKCLLAPFPKLLVPCSYDLYFLLLVNSTVLCWYFGIVSTVLFASNLGDNWKNCVNNMTDKWHLTIVNISYLQNVCLKCKFDATELNNRPQKSFTDCSVLHIDRREQGLCFLSWTTVMFVAYLVILAQIHYKLCRLGKLKWPKWPWSLWWTCEHCEGGQTWLYDYNNIRSYWE